MRNRALALQLCALYVFLLSLVNTHLIKQDQTDELRTLKVS